MHLSLLPLKLQLDQRSVAFLQELFHSADSAVAAGLRLEEFEDEVVVSRRELQFIFCLQNCFLPLSRNLFLVLRAQERFTSAPPACMQRHQKCRAQGYSCSAVRSSLLPFPSTTGRRASTWLRCAGGACGSLLCLAASPYCACSCQVAASVRTQGRLGSGAEPGSLGRRQPALPPPTHLRSAGHLSRR